VDIKNQPFIFCAPNKECSHTINKDIPENVPIIMNKFVKKTSLANPEVWLVSTA
jgi:hypothetical protein